MAFSYSTPSITKSSFRTKHFLSLGICNGYFFLRHAEQQELIYKIISHDVSMYILFSWGFLLYGPKVIQMLPYSDLSADIMTVYTVMTFHALRSLTGPIRRVRIK